MLRTKTGLERFSRYRWLWLAKWLAPHMAFTEREFQKKFGMKSFPSGGAWAAGAANIPFEIRGSHGGWQTREAQLRYMEIDPQRFDHCHGRPPPSGAVPGVQHRVLRRRQRGDFPANLSAAASPSPITTRHRQNHLCILGWHCHASILL